MDKVSICLLTYNRAGLISQTIETILNQSLSDFELIINDNCSSDETESICREFAKQDNRIRYYRNQTNLGLTGNYQAAFDRSSEKYVAFLHDSDLYHPDLLSNWLDALERYPSAAFVFNSIEAIDFEDRLISSSFHEYPPLIHPGFKLRDEMLSQWGSPVNGMVMLNRKCVEDVGMFDPNRFPVLGDVDMWMRLAAKFDVAYIRRPLIQARKREENHFAENWPVLEELYQIHHLNTLRRYEGKPAYQKIRLFFLSVRRSLTWTRYWLGFVRRGNTKMTLEGGQTFKESRSIFLWVLGKVMTPILLLIAVRRSRSNRRMEQRLMKIKQILLKVRKNKVLYRLARALYKQARGNIANDMMSNGEMLVQNCVISAWKNGGLKEPRLVVFDVGANIGDWSYSLLNQLTSSTKREATDLYMFEPVPSTFEFLKNRLGSENPALHYEPVALSSETGESVIYLSDQNDDPYAGSNSLYAQSQFGHEQHVAINKITATDFCKDHKIEKVHLLKCDTEGHDMEVIRGALPLLAEERISILQFEYNHVWIYSRNFLKDVFVSIEKLPYKLVMLQPDQLWIFSEWHHELERFYEGNYALVHDDAIAWFPTRTVTWDRYNSMCVER